MRSTALLVLSITACGAKDVCSNLGASPTCDNTTAQKCEDALTQAKAKEPACEPQLTALASCISTLTLTCVDSSSIAANGDGMDGAGQNFTSVGDFSVVVNDSKCDVSRRGLEACRTCPDADGAKTPNVLGVGDKCPASVPCATGLSCQSGICTKSCSADDDCKARADGCKLQYQYGNVCASGKCTRGCADDYLCSADVSSSSKCVNSACSL
jgi:hypothetical protein